MDDEGGAGRFTPQNKTTHERLSTNTVGLVALSDFRKRRAEVLEQQEREAREAALSGTSTPDRSNTATPDHAGSDSAHGRASGSRPAKKPKKKGGRKLLSFDDGGGCDDDNDNVDQDGAKGALVATVPSGQQDESGLGGSKFKANAAVGVVPRSLTKAALRKEATEREALRREFMVMQEAVKAAEIAIPFTFYDGANIRGGTVRVKKGDYIWVFLDRSRKVGARQGVGEKAHTLRAWARKGVDDLMLVRGTVIIPHVRLLPLLRASSPLSSDPSQTSSTTTFITSSSARPWGLAAPASSTTAPSLPVVLLPPVRSSLGPIQRLLPLKQQLPELPFSRRMLI